MDLETLRGSWEGAASHTGLKSDRKNGMTVDFFEDRCLHCSWGSHRGLALSNSPITSAWLLRALVVTEMRRKQRRRNPRKCYSRRLLLYKPRSV